jgi:hypothetical protein
MHISSSWRSRGLSFSGWDISLHSSEPEASLGENPTLRQFVSSIDFKTPYDKNP